MYTVAILVISAIRDAGHRLEIPFEICYLTSANWWRSPNPGVAQLMQERSIIDDTLMSNEQ